MTMFELLNGEPVRSGTSCYNSSNRAFRYGDGLFETIKVVNKTPLFANDHFSRLSRGLAALKMVAPAYFSFEFLMQQIQQLLSYNHQENARVRLVIFRKAEGYYMPSGDELQWHLACESISDEQYPVNSPGLVAGIYENDRKCYGNLSSVKTLNGLLFVLAGIAARDSGWDDALIRNAVGNIVESSTSNLFIKKGKSYFTPPLTDGCMDGVLRKNVLVLARENGIEITESPVTEADLLGADEVLLTNVMRGVHWIKSIGEKQYTGTGASLFNQWLNKATGLTDNLA